MASTPAQCLGVSCADRGIGRKFRPHAPFAVIIPRLAAENRRSRSAHPDLDLSYECRLATKPRHPPLGHAAAVASIGMPHSGAARLHAGHGRGSFAHHADVPWRRAAAAGRAIACKGRWTDARQPHTSRGSLRVRGRRHGCATADHVADAGRSDDARRRADAAGTRCFPPDPASRPLTKGASRHRLPRIGLERPFDVGCLRWHSAIGPPGIRCLSRTLVAAANHVGVGRALRMASR